MNHNHGLQPVAKVAKANERNAARQMGETMRRANEQKAQLETLVGYREEYYKHYAAASRQGLSARQLQEYQVFLQRLDAAIAEQRQQVDQALRQCEQSRSQWQGRHNHSRMIDKVVERRNQVRQQTLERNLQKELDDRRPVTSTVYGKPV